MAERTALLGAEREPKKGELYGYVALGGSTLFFTVMLALVRFNNGYRGFSPASSIVVRGLTQFALSSVAACVFVGLRRCLAFPRRLVPLLCFRGLVDALAISCGYLALKYIPLAVDISIFYSTPIITVLLANLVLGERVSIIELCSMLLTVAGCMLTANPSLSLPSALPPNYVLGCLFSLLCGTGRGGAVICVRALGQRVHFVTNVLVMSIGIVICGVAMGGYNIPELHTDRYGVLIAVLSSVSGFIGQILLNVGFQHARAGTGTLITCAELPLFYLFGWLCFGETLSAVSCIGASIVIFSTSLVGFEAIRKENKSTPNNIV